MTVGIAVPTTVASRAPRLIPSSRPAVIARRRVPPIVGAGAADIHRAYYRESRITNRATRAPRGGESQRRGYASPTAMHDSLNRIDRRASHVAILWRREVGAPHVVLRRSLRVTCGGRSST